MPQDMMVDTSSRNVVKPDDDFSSKPQKATFIPGLRARIRMFNFLDKSYEGGVNYKNSLDAHGRAVLIAHENERGGQRQTAEDELKRAMDLRSGHTTANRYNRRLQLAAYENHVRAIVDRISAYLSKASPHRHKSTNLDMNEVAEVIFLDRWMEDMIHTGLKLGESWIGYDTVRIPVNEDGTFEHENLGPIPLTESLVAELDPKNRGRAYIVMADPSNVVDFTIKDGDVIRIVIREVEESKESFADTAKKSVYYKEWTPTEWIRYREVDDEENKQAKKVRKSLDVATTTADGTSDNQVEEIEVEIVERQLHNFGECPWFRFKPSFPIQDIAELSRALFNVQSLLDEELYSNTFTQKWITGVKGDQIQSTTGGSGNTLVLESTEAKTGVYGAVAGNAVALHQRVLDLRDAIYMIVSMENTNTKNAPEAAEKKKRDLESLYTMLVRIIEDVETIENSLLQGMGLIPRGDTTMYTNYDRAFDVSSLAEMVELTKSVMTLPYVPSVFKRNQISMLIDKIHPFGDKEEYRKELSGLMETDQRTIETVLELRSKGLITDDMIARLLAIPTEERKAYLDEIARHKEEEKQAERLLVEMMNNEVDDANNAEDQDDDESDEEPNDKDFSGRRAEPAD